MLRICAVNGAQELLSVLYCCVYVVFSDRVCYVTHNLHYQKQYKAFYLVHSINVFVKKKGASKILFFINYEPVGIFN